MKFTGLLLIIFLLFSAINDKVYSQTTNSESFDVATFPPAGWIVTPGGTHTWARNTGSTTHPATTPHSGSGEAYANCYSASSGSALLITPVIDKSSRGAATDSVVFWMFRDNGSYNTTYDSLAIYVNTAANLTGASRLGKINRAYSLPPAVASQGWYRYAFYIPAAYNTVTNYIVFQSTSKYGNDIMVDDITWYSFSNAPANPSNFTATPVSSSQINLGWALNGSGNNIMLAWNTTNTFGTPINGTSYGTGSTITGGGTVLYNGNGLAYNHSSLNPSTTYYYKVWSKNALTYYSSGIAANATTFCNVVNTYPYAYGFGTTGTLDPCWSIQQVALTGNWTLAASMTSPAMTPYSGPYMAYFNSYGFTNGTQSRLKTNVMDFTSLTSPRLSFYMSRDNSYPSPSDSLLIEVSTNGGTSWNAIYPAFQRYSTNALPYWDPKQIDLSAYAGNSNVMLGFRACSAYGDNMAIDSITIKNAMPLSYNSSTATQTVLAVCPIGASNQQIIGVQVVANGEVGTLNLGSFAFSTNGSTNASVDISAARVWYTGTSSVFAATTQFGSDYNNPRGSFGISGSQNLQAGTNYFWLVYDISPGATPGNLVDAECNSITIGGNPQVPLVQAPAGSRTIMAAMGGVYTVGISAFNKISGKHIYAQELSRKVNISTPIQKNIKNIKDYKLQNTTGYKNEQESYENQFVTEKYYELYENGVKYTGPLYYPGSGNDNITGVYATLTSATGDLNSRGVNNATTFLLTDAVYSAETYPIQINNNIPGISATKTVIIRPQSGVTALIPGNAASGAAIKILCSYVTLDGSNSGTTSRDLTIQNTSVTAPSVILVGSTGTTSITNVVIENCNLVNGSQSSTALVVSDAAALGSAGYFSNITIQNNSISTAFIGVYVNGGTVPQNGSNVYLLNNTINASGTNAITGIGLYMQGVNGAMISGNDIGNIINADASSNERIGIWAASGTINTTIQKNKIHDLQFTGTGGWSARGINITTTVSPANITAQNNFIYNITADGDSYASIGAYYDPVGIYANGTQTGINIFNNSIYLYGNTINLAGAYSHCIDLGTGSTADVRNNILVNNLGLLSATGVGAVCLSVQSSASQLVNSNYNCLYSSPVAGIGNLGKISTTDYSTIAQWRNASSLEQKSFNLLPAFTSLSDLHIQATSLSVSGRGTYIAGVTDDFDGDARAAAQSATMRPVDVGADQYLPSSYSGNTLLLGGQFYQDGGLNSLRIMSGTFTFTSIKQYPGVRSPYNTFMQSPGNKNNNIKDNIIKKNKDGRSGALKGQLLPVNEPWIYWEINGLVVQTEPITIRFFYNPEMLATINENNLRVSYWNGTAWDNNFSPQSINTGNHSIDVTLPTGNSWGSTMHFAIEDISSPLPVTLSSFSANTFNRDVSLLWKTSAEVNNSGFDIERRMQGTKDAAYNDWQKIAFVKGAGTTNNEQVYTYKDAKLVTGKYQYRLKQIDYNNNFEFFNLSSPDAVEIGKPKNADVSQNYPNPSNPKSRIDYQIPLNGMVSLKVYDVIGREVTTIVNEYKEAGYYTAEFDGTNLASGVYFYKLESGTFSLVKKMVLLK